MMQIGGWIHLTSSNTDEVIYLLAAYIDGRQSDIFMDVAVKPHAVNEEQVVLYMVPPLETDATKPFTATIVVEDQYNRKHTLPVQSFRATSSQAPPPPKVGKPADPAFYNEDSRNIFQREGFHFDIQPLSNDVDRHRNAVGIRFSQCLLGLRFNVFNAHHIGPPRLRSLQANCKLRVSGGGYRSSRGAAVYALCLTF